MVGAIEIHPSSTVKGDVKNILSMSRDDVEDLRGTHMDKYVLDLEDKRYHAYKMGLQAVRKSIEETYLSAGIVVNDDRFPKVNIYNTNVQAVKKEAGFRQRGFSGRLSNRVELYPKGGSMSFLDDLKILHHEIDHALGRQVAVADIKKTRLPYFKQVILAQQRVTVDAQLGFITKFDRKKTRGRVLEEGLMSYLAEEFILTSNDEIVKKARTNLANYLDQENKQNDSFEIKQICKKFMKDSELERYNVSTMLIETLIEGARKIGEDEAIEMKKDLIRTRVNTKNTRKLMDRIDRIFGQGTTSKIYKMKFEEIKNGENLIFINEMREKIGLSKE